MKTSLAPADKLKREIQAVLTDDLRSDQHRLGHVRYDGFAYPAAEAYLHLGGGYAAGLRPMQLKHRSKGHWWLLDSEGRVIDLTLSPRETSDFPYQCGTPTIPLHVGRDLPPGADDRGARHGETWLSSAGRTILGRCGASPLDRRTA
jgi:hypothetical protein